tara:strand:- start:1191 stop:1454 length:264 start_codon:yes stop_codon:yes gene_type:complete
MNIIDIINIIKNGNTLKFNSKLSGEIIKSEKKIIDDKVVQYRNENMILFMSILLLEVVTLLNDCLCNFLITKINPKKAIKKGNKIKK